MEVASLRLVHIVLSSLFVGVHSFHSSCFLYHKGAAIRNVSKDVLRLRCKLDGFPADNIGIALNVIKQPIEVYSSSLTYLKSLHPDALTVLSFILLLSKTGLTLEKKTTIGKSLSAPLATMAMTLIMANIGVIPFTSPVYDFISRYLVTLAVPLLLFDSNISRVLSGTGSLLLAFLLGTVATIIGTFAAFLLVPLTSLGCQQGWKIAAALGARHIGGAINFVAVCESFNVAGSAVSAAIAADNVVIALYFAFLFYFAKPSDFDSLKDERVEPTQEIMPVDPESIDTDRSFKQSISLSSLATSLTVASCIVSVGKIAAAWLLPVGTSALPLVSVLTVAAATICPRFFAKLQPTGSALGVLFMQMFFAASGASGSIKMVLESAPSLFLFSILQITVHFIVLMVVGKFILKIDSKELYLASNANIGGPTTAAAMAQAKGWRPLVLPALLVGILGYAVATPIGLAIGPLLARLLK